MISRQFLVLMFHLSLSLQANDHQGSMGGMHNMMVGQQRGAGNHGNHGNQVMGFSMLGQDQRDMYGLQMNPGTDGMDQMDNGQQQ